MSAGAGATVDWLESLLRAEVEHSTTAGGVVDALGAAHDAGSDTARPFEGLYGRGYSRMIRSHALRRAFFGLWGGAEVLFDLDAIVRAAAAGSDAAGAPLLDVPCGQGVIAELLAADGWGGRVVGLDLARRATEQAAGTARGLSGDLDARYVLGTALDLPFRTGSIGAIISINGLHVMPDHAGFLRELARVLVPGGSCWLVTPVTGPGLRGAAMLRGGRALGVLSQSPPTGVELDELARAAGFAEVEHLAGSSAERSNVVGVRLTAAAR